MNSKLHNLDFIYLLSNWGPLIITELNDTIESVNILGHHYS